MTSERAVEPREKLRREIEALLAGFYTTRNDTEDKLRRCITCGRMSPLVPLDAEIEAAPIKHEPDCEAAAVLAIVERLATARGESEPRTPYGVVPANCRLILASDNLLDVWGSRTERGERITVEWGEPKPEGWYEPTFTVHADDRLGTLDEAWAAAEAALPEGWWFECYISGAIAGDVNPHTGYRVTNPEHRYVATAQPTWYPLGPDNDSEPVEERAEADTPAAALLALADALRAVPA